MSLAMGGTALAQGTINSVGDGFSAGIGANGELYNPGDGTGFRRNGDGYDPISPGTPRDSWGIAVVGGGGAYGDQAFFGSSNIVGTTSVFSGAGALVTTTTSLGLTVEQDYSFVSGGNILRILTSVTNTGGDLGEVLFQRNVDWDIAPNETDERVTGPYGAFGAVVDSSYLGFEDPDPNTPYGFSCFAGCDATGDLGGGIKISLGSLAGGATARFVYYYGLSDAGQSTEDLIAEGQAAGARYLIAGASQGGENSAFIGVGAVVPEPGVWAMMILGFFGLGSMLRRRQTAAA